MRLSSVTYACKVWLDNFNPICLNLFWLGTTHADIRVKHVESNKHEGVYVQTHTDGYWLFYEKKLEWLGNVVHYLHREGRAKRGKLRSSL